LGCRQSERSNVNRTVTGGAVMMTLELREPDEGLLVPFKHTTDDEHVGLQRPIPSPRRASLSRFFRRRRSNDNDGDAAELQSSLLNSPTTNDDQKYNDFQDQHEPSNPLIESSSSEEEEESDDESEGSSDGSGEEEDSGDESGDDRGRHCETQPSSSSPQRDHCGNQHGKQKQQNRTPRMWRPYTEPQKQGLLENDSFINHDEHCQQSRVFKLEGFGSAPALPDPRDNALHRFFRRIVHRSELKTMKIATEQTKNEKTLKDHFEHAVTLAVAPELADDEHDENTLGYYRTVLATDDEVDNHQSISAVEEDARKKAVYWRNETKRLIARVEALESELNTARFEASSWKFRAKELEKQVQKLQNNDSDGEHEENSDDEESDSDSGEESCDEDKSQGSEHETEVKADVLIETEVEEQPPQFDPLASTLDTETASADSNEGLLNLSLAAGRRIKDKAHQLIDSSEETDKDECVSDPAEGTPSDETETM
jgi:hypothetical protein